MPDNPKPSHPLSEIGHLFLSSIRQQQMRGAPLPQRRPPARFRRPLQPPARLPRSREAGRTIDLTPEELAQVYGEGEAEDLPQASPGIAAHTAGHRGHRGPFQFQADGTGQRIRPAPGGAGTAHRADRRRCRGIQADLFRRRQGNRRCRPKSKTRKSTLRRRSCRRPSTS